MKTKIINLLYIYYMVTLTYPFQTKSIIKCLTKDESKGFCREKLECVGAKVPLVSNNCPANFICCPVRAVSRKHCYTYAKAVYTKSSYKPVHHDELQQKQADGCGITTVPLNVGWEDVLPKEFPHMVALGYKELESSKNTWDCGGSLVSELYVLTTAHCCSSKRNPPKVVKLGAVTINSTDSYVQLREVRKVIMHPEYAQNAQIKYNDIALLRMHKKVTFSQFVRPICLDYKGNMNQKKVLTIGYKASSNNAKSGGRDLLKAMWDVFDEKECKLRWQNTFKGDLPGNMFCAGSSVDDSDTCAVDSGGSLQVMLKNPYCMFSQIACTLWFEL